MPQSNFESNWSKLSKANAWNMVGIKIIDKTNITPISLPPNIWVGLRGFVINNSNVPWVNSSEKLRILKAGIKKRNKMGVNSKNEE